MTYLTNSPASPNTGSQTVVDDTEKGYVVQIHRINYVLRRLAQYTHDIECVYAVLEIRRKWWMDKCPSTIIWDQTILLCSDVFLDIQITWQHHCVYVSDEHLGSAQPSV